MDFSPSGVSDHLESLQRNLFLRPYSGFLSRYRYLLLHSIDAVQIRQKQSPAMSAGNDHAVAFYIQFVFRKDILGLSEYVYTDLQPLELIRTDWLGLCVDNPICLILP